MKRRRNSAASFFALADEHPAIAHAGIAEAAVAVRVHRTAHAEAGPRAGRRQRHHAAAERTHHEAARHLGIELALAARLFLGLLLALVGLILAGRLVVRIGIAGRRSEVAVAVNGDALPGRRWRERSADDFVLV